MSKEARDVFFNGRKDADGRSIDRGVVSIRGVKAAAEIGATMQELEEVADAAANTSQDL